MCNRALQFWDLPKERETSPTENPPPNALYAARDQKLIGMLTDTAPCCRPWPGGTSPTLGWSVMIVKLVGSGRLAELLCDRTSEEKIWKWTSKRHFSDRNKKKLLDVSAGTSQFKKILYVRILSGIWCQSWQGQLWPRPVELGLTL